MRFDDLAEINPSVPIRKRDVRPFIDMSALPQHARDVSELGEREFTGSGSRFLNGDTLIARITPCLENGKGALVHSLPEGVPGFGSTEFIVARARSERDTRFVYYLTRSEEFRDIAISRMEGTSGRQRVSWQQIASIEIPDLHPDEREEIGDILALLDDKIELNRRMAATLEEMARALYRSWFVDFDPVKAKAEGLAPAFMDEATTALFPDRFRDDGLPEGWERGALIDLSSLNPEKWGTRNAPDMVVYVDLSNTKWGVIEATTTYSWTEAPSRARMVLQPGDTIVGTVRPGNGSYAYVAEAGLTGSTGFAVLRPNRSNDAALVNLAATDADNLASLTNLADGGAYPAVRPEVVGASEVVIAAEMVRDAFAAQVIPIVNRIEEAKRESRSLATLRDTLLPKLMSGELRVGEARDQIEEVA